MGRKRRRRRRKKRKTRRRSEKKEKDEEAKKGANKESSSEDMEDLVYIEGKSDGMSIESSFKEEEYEFVASESFEGAKEGFVFTTRDGKTGYYSEQPVVREKKKVILFEAEKENKEEQTEKMKDQVVMEVTDRDEEVGGSSGSTKTTKSKKEEPKFDESCVATSSVFREVEQDDNKNKSVNKVKKLKDELLHVSEDFENLYVIVKDAVTIVNVGNALAPRKLRLKVLCGGGKECWWWNSNFLTFVIAPSVRAISHTQLV